MKTTLLIPLFIFLAVCVLPAQNYPAGDFHAIVISDTHISNDETKDARLAWFVDRVNQKTFPGVDFLINTGDVGSSVYKEYDPDNPSRSYNRLGKAVSILDELSIPYYLAMGNHDYKIDSDRDSDLPFAKEEILMMEDLWMEITGFNPYYSFEHKGWKFIVLNSMHGRHLDRFFGDDQMEWLANELNQPSPALLFFHHPLKTDHFRLWGKLHHIVSSDKEPEFFEMLLTHKDQIKGIFVGHGHMWVQDKLFRSIPVFETDSFGEEEQQMRYHIIGFDNESSSISVSRMPVKLKYRNEVRKENGQY